MSQQRGFTLMELMLALALTGVVALLVYGAAGVALDTHARLVTHRRAARTEQAWHAVIEDALRNLRANGDSPRPTFVLTPGTDASGRPRDRLELVTAGGTPPLTDDTDWSATVEIGDAGLTLTAVPIGVRVPTRRITGMPDITGLDIRVLGGMRDLQWLDQWAHREELPRAVELTYWTDEGPVGPAVLVTLPLGATP